MASIALSRRNVHILRFYEKAFIIKSLNPFFSTFISIKPCIIKTGLCHGCVFIYTLYYFKIMPFSDFKVIRVVSRCNLNGTRAFFGIRIFIRYKRDLTPYHRKYVFLAYPVLVSVIIKAYGNRNISEHRLGSAGCNYYGIIAIRRIISEIPVLTVFFFMLYLSVR